MKKTITHYYGDIVRVIFITVAAIILFGLPQVIRVLHFPAVVAIFTVVILGIAAGVTNPIQPGSMFFNVLVSLFGLLAFAYTSVFMYANHLGGFLLVLNQIIAVAFLVAVYLSIKTYRGYLFADRTLVEKENIS